ncbi:porin family protein [uncultured Prevotella sp.]|uniref:porin family protein n=1 Tax=uncultured Prevotella sp. TaxID=159272 RepID=UPI0027E359EC|nr:porin family protein [uncultured Prevotella sp.]
MKKIFTTAVLAAAMLFSANSAEAQVKFGIKGGLNVTSMSLDSKVLDAENRAGFFIGPTLKFTLPVVGLGIDASALYDQREAKAKAEVEGAEVESNFKTQSVNIPINVRYGFGLGSTASIFLFAGPQFGFNVGDKNQSIFKDMGEWRLKSSTFSVNVGVGAMLLSHLQLSANYNIACGKTGDMTVSKALGETGQNLFSKNGRTNAWQIGLAYYF